MYTLYPTPPPSWRYVTGPICCFTVYCSTDSTDDKVTLWPRPQSQSSIMFLSFGYLRSGQPACGDEVVRRAFDSPVSKPIQANISTYLTSQFPSRTCIKTRTCGHLRFAFLQRFGIVIILPIIEFRVNLCGCLDHTQWIGSDLFQSGG